MPGCLILPTKETNSEHSRFRAVTRPGWHTASSAPSGCFSRALNWRKCTNMSIHVCPPPLTVAATQLQRQVEDGARASLTCPSLHCSLHRSPQPSSRHAWGPQPRPGSSCRKSEVPAPAHGFLSEGDRNQRKPARFEDGSRGSCWLSPPSPGLGPSEATPSPASGQAPSAAAVALRWGLGVTPAESGNPSERRGNGGPVGLLIKCSLQAIPSSFLPECPATNANSHPGF